MPQPSWVLGDGTRIDLASMVNPYDSSLFAPREWAARVNGTPVPTATTRLGRAWSASTFPLPDGRLATARVQQRQGVRIFDLSVGDQTLVWPGGRPFSCPQCTNQVEPQDRTCPACKAEQPSYHDRVLQLQRRGISNALLRLNLGCILLGLGQLLAFRPEPAFAALYAADPSMRDLLAVAHPDAGLQASLGYLAAYMLCVFAFAWIALYAPVIASLINVLAFGVLLGSRVLIPSGSWVAVGIATVLLASTLVTAWRAIGIARRARNYG